MYKREISFHLFKYLLSVTFYSFQCMSYAAFIKFISKSFIPFWCYYTWNCFLNFMSRLLLLGYRNSVNFGISTLYPAVLLNSLNGSNSFLCVHGFLRMFCIQGHVICEEMFAIHPFQPKCLFFFLSFFFCQITLASTSSTILNTSGKNRYTSLLPNLSRKASIFHH